ncbi:uncharacterized protein isoform X1 [Castor canadensis]|uniref:Uncharacterized protein isoform X1 n=1 Tax=Castor canadensis TaxID=51338 RepID=A0AC58L5Q0_CASCN
MRMKEVSSVSRMRCLSSRNTDSKEEGEDRKAVRGQAWPPGGPVSLSSGDPPWRVGHSPSISKGFTSREENRHPAAQREKNWDPDFWCPDLNMEFNPSDHPRASTIFLSKSQTDVREKRKSLFINHHPPGQIARKYSSCSTIFLDDSTVSQPNLKYTIKCVALAIYYHIKNRDPDGRMLLDIFDENLHPLSKSEVPPDCDKHNPEQKQIYRFVWTLFSAAQLTAECAIVTLLPEAEQPPLPRAPTATMFCFATAMESANHGPSLCHCEPKSVEILECSKYFYLLSHFSPWDSY